MFTRQNPETYINNICAPSKRQKRLAPTWYSAYSRRSKTYKAGGGVVYINSEQWGLAHFAAETKTIPCELTPKTVIL